MLLNANHEFIKSQSLGFATNDLVERQGFTPGVSELRARACCTSYRILVAASEVERPRKTQLCVAEHGEPGFGYLSL